LQEKISTLTDYWMSILGVFFVLAVVFFPRGVLGMIKRKQES